MSFVDASSLRNSISLLIYQLTNVHRISEGIHPDIFRITGSILIELECLQDELNRSVDNQDKLRIFELEEEIRYLKELNVSQRTMMEDNLKYLKGLEDRLNSSQANVFKD